MALLHNPELLILDEPTVGVDPMLRQSIWNHLIRLSTEQKKTILITTHYIEEARQANTVRMSNEKSKIVFYICRFKVFESFWVFFSLKNKNLGAHFLVR